MPRATRIARLIGLIVLIAAVITATALLLFTERGQHLLHHHHEAGVQFHDWVNAHRMFAPGIFIGVYVLCMLLMLPVWWLQILAGYGFGILLGVVWSQIGATLGAAGGLLISRFIAADWFKSHVEARLTKLRELDQTMGHNGFMVVMAVRLMHFVPGGISNYVFGLTSITLTDVIVGTALGGIPSVAIYVGIGSGFHPRADWRFLAAIAALNVLLLVPILLRYLKPQWFKKYGIE